MNTGSRVVDALELARHRLHEPNVRASYMQLIALIDQQLGEHTLEGSATGMLTEPQLVLISYGLRHLQGAPAVNMIRAADKLIAALSQPDASATPPVVPLAELRARREADGAAQDADSGAGGAAHESPRHPAPESENPPTQTFIKRLVQSVGKVTGGTVNMTGHNTTIYHVSPNAHSAEPAVEEDDTGELHPVSAEQEITVSDVFISYCHRDGSRMRRLREDLRSHGLRVWTDENLQPGTPSWKKAVESAVRGGRVLVVLMSPDAKRSSWVESEINTAMTYDVPIFPVLCKGDTKNAVPFALNGYQFVDMRKEAQYRQEMLRLVKAIKTRLKGVTG